MKKERGVPPAAPRGHLLSVRVPILRAGAGSVFILADTRGEAAAPGGVGAMRNDFNSMKLVGYRPDGSFLKVRMETDTPDGTYWLPGVQIVVRTSAGWSLWRYVLTILKTVFRARNPRIGNLILAGAGIGRLAGVPGIGWRKGSV